MHQSITMIVTNSEINVYDVIIAGAGPAGCALALALHGSGLKVALFDKSSFPRNKVCGDAIPGRAIKTLRNINPEYEQAFKNYPKKNITKYTKIRYNQREITMKWVLDAYTCTRWEFDNFLLELVRKHTNTDIFTGIAIAKITRLGDHIEVETDGKQTYNCIIIAGADGAHSVVAKSLGGKTMDREHQAVSVRAYYTGVTGLQPDTTYIYLNKQFLPSYLWVFPLADQQANVGIGMHSMQLINKKVNLRKYFYEFIETDPALVNNFKSATQSGELEGFSLPLGSGKGRISGDRYVLLGDAASLIDPATGDGIGNAMLSGLHAGKTIRACFEGSDFSEQKTLSYDKALYKAIGKELNTHHILEKLLTRSPLLFDVAFVLYNNRFIRYLLKKLF